jgi:hypothetical protein
MPTIAIHLPPGKQAEWTPSAATDFLGVSEAVVVGIKPTLRPCDLTLACHLLPSFSFFNNPLAFA